MLVFGRSARGNGNVFVHTITPSVSGTDQHCFKGKGARSRRNGGNAEKAIAFHNFLRVFQKLLASIVAFYLTFVYKN